jgi:hypothetical protein
MLTETDGLLDGKAVPGVTVLKDTRTGQEYLVTAVASGKLPTPIDASADRRGSSAERCALFGSRAKWKAED